MNIIKSNKPAISKPIVDNELNVRVYTANMRYIDDNKMIVTATVDAPIYRYAKNYSLEDIDYCIIMLTSDNNTQNVQDYFDKLSQNQNIDKIKRDLSSSYSYLDDTYKENK